MKQASSYEIYNIELEQAYSFKYLCSAVNNDSTIEDEIKERMAAGNKVFHPNKKTMFSKLLTRISKMCIYKSLIRPVVTYGCESWILKDIREQQLRVFER